ncbi:cell division protein ZapD [Nitrosospira multiformis]|uniref:Cell division protein ZapD n=1 Tax=Nitrosospira multiformis TaxID=1231 RepID=A0A2T5IGZ5_9PROT|nr:cell division protein ZapD [Nitrosospira multiformis]PTQ83081.1 cell division protein ZapD [Nitrosospira multiformis]
MIRYEHPLNERVRTLLRLEDLFDKVAFFSAQEEPYDHHAALVTLFEILDVTGRADMKSELLQELDRQKQALELLRKSPENPEGELDEMLDDIQISSQDLRTVAGKIGEPMRDNEWLMGIKQRVGVPGGACEFDLPSYRYWLHLDPEVRRSDLDEWIGPLLPIEKSFRILLRLLRDSGRTDNYTANKGMFQQMGAGRTVHLLSLKLDESLPCVPEISAHKFALTIRFVVSSSTQKTRLYEEDVEFELTSCAL